MDENINQKTISELNKEQTNKIRQSLNMLIKQDVKMKKAVSGAKENLKNWQAREWALNNSNEKLKIELKNLQMENENVSQQIAIKTESHAKLDEEFRSFEERNSEEDEKFWQFFVAETDKYRNLFTTAEIKYNTASLKKDIENYDEMLGDMREKIGKIDEEIAESTNKFGLIELNRNEKANCLQDLQQFHQILIEYDKSLSLSIRSAENSLQELNSKIRQKRREIENISMKMNQKQIICSSII